MKDFYDFRITLDYCGDVEKIIIPFSAEEVKALFSVETIEATSSFQIKVDRDAFVNAVTLKLIDCESFSPIITLVKGGTTLKYLPSAMKNMSWAKKIVRLNKCTIDPSIKVLFLSIMTATADARDASTFVMIGKLEEEIQKLEVSSPDSYIERGKRLYNLTVKKEQLKKLLEFRQFKKSIADPSGYWSYTTQKEIDAENAQTKDVDDDGFAD